VIVLILIPPKYTMSQVVSFIRGKSAIHFARLHGESNRNCVGQSFWDCGFLVSTVGCD